MIFWSFMVIMLFLTPATMIGYGKKFMKAPPEQINAIGGYRTPMSMKNKETWKFAHNFCGKLWYNAGRFLLLSIPFMLLVLGRDEDTIGYFAMVILVIQVIPLVGVIIPTEIALKKI